MEKIHTDKPITNIITLPNLCIFPSKNPYFTATKYNIEGNTKEIGGTVIVLTKLKSQSIESYVREKRIIVRSTTLKR